MAFCPTCGSQVDGRFCAKCGSAVAAEAAAGGATPMPPPAAQASGMADNVASALCYLLGLLTGILFLVLAPYNQNRTIRFHAFQSIFMHLAVIAFFIVFEILLGALAFVGGFFVFALWPLLSLACLALWIF